MFVPIKKLYEDAKIPVAGSKNAAGYDLFAYIGDADGYYVYPGETVKFHTGIAASIPVGFFGAVFARSGAATKRGLRPANCVGVIDSDYRGEIIVALHNDSDGIQWVQNGERIAQLSIIPYLVIDGFEVVDELDETARGDGGFGSTGSN